MRHRPRTAMGFILAIVLCCGLSTPSCGPTSEPLPPTSTVSDNPAAERLFKEARELFESGDLQLAERAFNSLLISYPKDVLALSASVFLGRVAIEQGDYRGAQDILRPTARKKGKSTAVRRARFFLGVALYGAGETSKAVEMLEPFVGLLTDPEENILLLDSLWRAAADLKDRYREILWIDAYLTESTDDVGIGEAKAALKRACRETTDQKTLVRARDALDSDGWAWPLVMARLMELQSMAGEKRDAERTLAQLEEADRASDAAVVAAIEAMQAGTRMELNAVGCILPLSGRSRLVGEEALKGVMLGAELLKIGEELRSATVVIRDSGGDPAKAVKAVEEMVNEDHVAGIVGPVDGAVSVAAAKKAEELGVPMILLTMRDGASSIGQNIFRRFPSSSSEAEALVGAAERLGGEKYAIMLSKDSYGQAVAKAFGDALAKVGKKVSHEVGFAPKQTGFTQEAESLAEHDFDVLFVSGRASQLALIAPALAAAGLSSGAPGDETSQTRTVQILAPSSGMSDDLVKRAGRYLRGAIFATNFLAEASTSSAQFTQKFQDKYGRDPSPFAAFGHDAVILFAAALQGGAADRRQVRDWLQDSADSDADLPLLTPPRGFDKTGEAAGASWTLTLKSDGWELLR